MQFSTVIISENVTRHYDSVEYSFIIPEAVMRLSTLGNYILDKKVAQ